jgi:phosphoribosylcarboxyaminoimidazole (NCAIR) mutase
MTSIFSIPGAVQTATTAISRSTNALAKDASVVASQKAESRELISALVDSRQQVLYTAAAVKILNASDEMIKSVLDIKA